MIPKDSSKIGADDTKVRKDKDSVEEKNSENPRQSSIVDDVRRSQRFRDVLKKEDQNKIKKNIASSDDEDDESLSLFDLAGSNSTKETSQKNGALSVDPDEHKGNQFGFLMQDNTPKKAPTSSFSTQSTSSTIIASSVISYDDMNEQQKPIVQLIPEEITSNDTSNKFEKSLAKDSHLSHLIQQPTGPTVHVVPQASLADAKRIEAIQRREQLMSVIEQTVRVLQQVQLPDRMNIEITLQHPPLFEGVKIVLTEFNTAKKEFNITFYNMNQPEARALIQMKENQDLLRQSLLERGYTLQMVTIEPKLDVRTGNFSGQQDSSSRQQQKEKNKDNTHGGLFP